MGSLQDQMLKAGLVTAEQLQEAESEQHRARRQARDGERGQRGRAPEVRVAKVRARTRRDGDSASKRRPRPPTDRTGTQARRPVPPASAPIREPTPRASTPDDGGPDAEVRALNQKIRKLLAEHGRNDEAATLPFHFVQGGKVRRVRVTDEQRRALADGTLAIVLFQRRARIVPAAVAEEIHALRSIVFVHRASPDGAAEEGAAQEAGAAASGEDDPYRDFPVPDDLHW